MGGTATALCVYMAMNAPMAMPALHSIQEPLNPTPEEPKNKKHWNVAAANYIGAAGPMAVRWGKMGEHVEGERAQDEYENEMRDMGSDLGPELEAPTAAPMSKPPTPCWMIALLLSALV